MPRYEYKCPDCEALFEKYARMADSQAHQECPTCGAQSRRYYSKAPPIIMRPAGWNLHPDDPGYSTNFEKREFTRARYE